MTENQKTILKACEDKNLYDEIMSNRHLYSKDEILQVLSEVIYIATCRLSEEKEEEFYKQVKDSLIENFYLED